MTYLNFTQTNLDFQVSFDLTSNNITITELTSLELKQQIQNFCNEHMVDLNQPNFAVPINLSSIWTETYQLAAWIRHPLGDEKAEKLNTFIKELFHQVKNLVETSDGEIQEALKNKLTDEVYYRLVNDFGTEKAHHYLMSALLKAIISDLSPSERDNENYFKETLNLLIAKEINHRAQLIQTLSPISIHNNFTNPIEERKPNYFLIYGKKIWDFIKRPLGEGISILSAAGVGAGFGAYLGSIVPGLGTAIGSAIGAVFAAIGSTFIVGTIYLTSNNYKKRLVGSGITSSIILGLSMTLGFFLGTAIFPGLGTAAGLGLGAGVGLSLSVSVTSLFDYFKGARLSKLFTPFLGAIGAGSAGAIIGGVLGTFLFPGVGTWLGAAAGFILGGGGLSLLMFVRVHVKNSLRSLMNALADFLYDPRNAISEYFFEPGKFSRLKKLFDLSITAAIYIAGALIGIAIGIVAFSGVGAGVAVGAVYGFLMASVFTILSIGISRMLGASNRSEREWPMQYIAYSSIGLGGGIGALFGALIGSVIPVVGTFIGLGVGALIGSLATSTLVGFGRTLFNLKQAPYAPLITSVSVGSLAAVIGGLVGTFVFPGVGSAIGAGIGFASGSMLSALSLNAIYFLKNSFKVAVNAPQVIKAVTGDSPYKYDLMKKHDLYSGYSDDDYDDLLDEPYIYYDNMWKVKAEPDVRPDPQVRFQW